MGETRPFQRLYSAAQIAAIVAAQVDAGLTAPQAVDAARNGQLPEQAAGTVPAFDMKRSTAQKYAGQERARRRELSDMARLDVESEMRGMAREAVAAWRAELARMRETRGKRLDSVTLREWAKTGRELAALVRATAAQGPTREAQDGDGNGPDPASPDLLAALEQDAAAATEAGSGNGSGEPIRNTQTREATQDGGYAPDASQSGVAHGGARAQLEQDIASLHA